MILLVEKCFLFNFKSVYGSDSTVTIVEISIDLPERVFFTDHTIAWRNTQIVHEIQKEEMELHKSQYQYEDNT